MTGVIGIAFGVLSALLVAGYRQLALHQGWLDAPNPRSSHTCHTPRGAGIVFVLLISAAVGWWGISGAVPSQLAYALLLGVGVATIGWWDDLRGLGAGCRFGLYWAFVSVALVTVSSGSGLRWPLLLAASFAALWLVNLYNFMDGINGIAAAEALFVLAAGLWLARETPAFASLALITAVAVGALVGFMLWNFPIAQVFMGDVGSAYLGFFFGVLVQWVDSVGGPGVPVWLVLLGGFIVDASYTLFVRIVTGQRWRQAHRLHAYQLLAQRWGHAPVVGALMVVNLLWLLPWAVVLHRGYVMPAIGLLCAYLPLVVICYRIGAGSLRRAGV